MKTPKFVLVTPDYPPARGGVARYLGNLVESSSGGIRVVVPEKHSSDGPGDVSHAPFVGSGWPVWQPLVGTIRRIKNSTVLVSHVFPVGTATWLSSMIGGPKYILLLHGLDVRLAARNFWKRWLFRRICRRAKHVVANSLATARDAEKLYGSLPIVLTPGVEGVFIPSRETARRKLGIDQAAEIVLSVTRLVPRKGIDIALRAMSRIQKNSDVQYVVVGEGNDDERLEKMAEEHRTNVRWIRMADDAEKWNWYAAADVFLLPVRDEGNDVEGFGIAFLEAALAAVPSVAGRSGGAVEAVSHENTGLLVNPTDVGEIEGAVLKLLADEGLRKGMKKPESVQQPSFVGRIVGLRSSHCRKHMSKPDVSVVIPCYNHANVLRRTLEALSIQTFKPKEVVVVDDASADDAESVVKDFESRLAIRYMRLRHNHGAPYARNEGARLMSATYILFLDADAELVPDALEIYVKTLEAHPEADFAYANFYWGAKRFNLGVYDAELKKRNYIHTSSLIRREAFPGFDESLKKFQDWDLWFTMAARGSKGIRIDRELMRIEPRKQGMSRWLPKIAHMIPWQRLGFQPKEIGRYREAEEIVKKKQGL